MVETLLTRLARQSQETYYGKYRGFVADNADPEKRARLRLRVPSLLGDEITGWALPCLPYGGLAGQGLFAVPDVDAQLWVEFEAGDLCKPIWVGTFWQQAGDPPAEAAAPQEPTTRMLKTAAGSMLRFDDADGAERIILEHRKHASLTIDADGTVAIADAAGGAVTLDATGEEIVVEDANGNKLVMSSSGTTVEDPTGNRIELASSGITVKGRRITLEGTLVALGGAGGEPVIKGSSFLTLFATHVHPSASGPTGPPIPQGELGSLSTKVTCG